MKKPTPTTILLTTLLTASVIGNAYQYKAGEPAEELRINQPVTDEPEGEEPGKIFNPIRGESDKEMKTWQVTATWAITYQVKPQQGGLPDGYQVTVYRTDPEPTAIKAKEKPGKDDVTWAPIPEGLPGVISIKVHQVEVTGGNTAEE